MGWPQDAAVTQVAYWPESHCLDPHYPGHEAVMAQIDSHLPPGIALIGSDYRALHLEDRVDQGLAAAASIADWLNSRM
jgi:protoporphyrinogen oxidase